MFERYADASIIGEIGLIRLKRTSTRHFALIGTICAGIRNIPQSVRCEVADETPSRERQLRLDPFLDDSSQRERQLRSTQEKAPLAVRWGA